MSAFWASIVLSFIVSVIANLIHDPLLFLVGRWRFSSKKKRFEREAQFHQFIADIKSGKQDRYVYLVRICATMVMGFLGMMICGATGILLEYISDRPDARMLEFLFGLGSGFFLSFYLTAAARYHVVSYGLANFEKLDAEFKKRWSAQLTGD
jgi:hypothetical protein